MVKSVREISHVMACTSLRSQGELRKSKHARQRESSGHSKGGLSNRKVFLLRRTITMFKVYLGTFACFPGFPPTVGTTGPQGGSSAGSGTGEPRRKPPVSPSQHEGNVWRGCPVLGMLRFLPLSQGEGTRDGQRFSPHRE